MSDTTRINPNLQGGNSTVINRDLSNGTLINPAVNQVDPAATSINTALDQSLQIRAGTILCDGYVVDRKLDINTGEADLYLCKKFGRDYVAKVYRRKMAVKQEIIEKLKSIKSPNVAKVYATGEYEGYPVEILSYFKNGSLQGRKYSYTQLKTHIIPSLNAGLHALHENGIIHKDLKPSNIMLNDNGVDVSIIDFGISSVRESGNTVVVTKTGMTPEYSAPETFKNLFLSESDYYSFGVTIYELFCGHTPYANLDGEEREKYILIQKIPFPSDMPEDLQGLIRALTYNDITNRKNKANPNRRWGYEEVSNWCAGKTQTIPGEGIGSNYSAQGMPPYTFLRHAYTDKSELVYALATNWNEGKKQLYRGILSSFFKPFDPEIASRCLDAEEEASKRNSNDDYIFFRTLYLIDDETTRFYWRGRAYDNLKELGADLLDRLWKQDKTVDDYYGSMLEANILSAYAKAVVEAGEAVIKPIEEIERSYHSLKTIAENRYRVYYMLAYMLSGKRILNLSNRQFSSIDDIAVYMNELIHSSYSSFEEFCKTLMNERGSLNPQFECWLTAIGKRNVIQQWRNALK